MGDNLEDHLADVAVYFRKSECGWILNAGMCEKHLAYKGRGVPRDKLCCSSTSPMCPCHHVLLPK